MRRSSRPEVRALLGRLRAGRVRTGGRCPTRCSRRCRPSSTGRRVAMPDHDATRRTARAMADDLSSSTACRTRATSARSCAPAPPPACDRVLTAPEHRLVLVAEGASRRRWARTSRSTSTSRSPGTEVLATPRVRHVARRGRGAGPCLAVRRATCGRRRPGCSAGRAAVWIGRCWTTGCKRVAIPQSRRGRIAQRRRAAAVCLYEQLRQRRRLSGRAGAAAQRPRAAQLQLVQDGRRDLLDRLGRRRQPARCLRAHHRSASATS